MEAFERDLTVATDPSVRILLGAIGLVINNKGDTLYHRAFGYQSLSPDAPPLDPDSIIFLASAGKFLTHIAALQLVEKGIIGLDDSVYKFLPELEDLEVISPSTDPAVKFTLQPQVRPITLRHMLTHSSGIGCCDDALTEAWRSATPQKEWPEGTSSIITMFSTPLLVQPGDGWEYGHSIHWLQPLIQRAAGAKRFVDYMQEHVFEPLGLKQHTSYVLSTQEHIRSKVLRCVRREPDGSISACEEDELAGISASIADVKIMLLDLLAPESKLLKRESIDLLFKPAFAEGPGLEKIRKDEDTFARTIGLEPDAERAAVNFTAAGALVTEEAVPESHLPAGTLSWNGWPNLIWTINREKGIATLFATQLVPVDDEKTLVHMKSFLKGAWSTFG